MFTFLYVKVYFFKCKNITKLKQLKRMRINVKNVSKYLLLVSCYKAFMYYKIEKVSTNDLPKQQIMTLDPASYGSI